MTDSSENTASPSGTVHTEDTPAFSVAYWEPSDESSTDPASEMTLREFLASVLGQELDD